MHFLMTLKSKFVLKVLVKCFIMIIQNLNLGMYSGIFQGNLF